MSQDNHLRPTRISNKKPRRGGAQVALRLLMLLLVCGLLGVAGLLLLRVTGQRGASSDLQVNLVANSSLNPVEAAALATYLTVNRDSLNTPAGSDSTSVPFTIEPGQHASQIATNLQSLGLITDPTLFRNYLRYYGLDVQLEAGTYSLSSSMTIPEIAGTLTAGQTSEVVARITEGWRREQTADWLDQQGTFAFTGVEYLAASAGGGGASVPATLAADIPVGATLEGFLFPDTYRLEIDATAIDLVNRMLENFDSKVTAQMRADAAARGMTLYQVVTLASIVEREAAVADERPTIASVYLNRLAVGMKLEADPTVQYAMGYQQATGQWWNLNLTQDDYHAVESPYNTYLYEGLPPGPIDSPGVDSISAVIYPADTPYLYFRAACDGSGRHNFAVTFEAHVANACP